MLSKMLTILLRSLRVRISSGVWHRMGADKGCGVAFRKKNGLARGLSKHAPLIAILMALLMGGGGLLMGWRLQRIGGELRKATAHVDDLEHRLTAAQVWLLSSLSQVLGPAMRFGETTLIVRHGIRVHSV
jgi:hypothetical protein